MRAVGEYILVEPLSEQVSHGGLILNEQNVAAMRYKRGRVLSIGGDIDFVAVGEEIYYDKARTFTLIIEGKSTTVVRGRDVVVVLGNNNKKR